MAKKTKAKGFGDNSYYLDTWHPDAIIEVVKEKEGTWFNPKNDYGASELLVLNALAGCPDDELTNNRTGETASLLKLLEVDENVESLLREISNVPEEERCSRGIRALIELITCTSYLKKYGIRHWHE